MNIYEEVNSVPLSQIKGRRLRLDRTLNEPGYLKPFSLKNLKGSGPEVS